MNKSIKSVVFSTALLVLTGANASEFSGSYAGVKVGSNRADTTGVGSSARAATYGLEGGHGWDVAGAMLAVDGFYDKNRETTHEPLLQDYGSTVYGLGLKLGLPLSDNLMPYAKFGYARTNGTGSLVHFDGSNVHGGLGLEYKLSSNLSVAGEWTSTAPNRFGNRFNNDNFTIGLNYYFSHGKSASVATPTPDPAPARVSVAKKSAVAVEPAAPAQPQPKESVQVVAEEKLVRIEGAHFDSNSAKLKPSAHAKLQEVVEFSKKYSVGNLEVSGYTDSSGNQAMNLTLSEKRAQSVKDYLVTKGVAASHVITKGYGIANPVADNSTVQGRTLNRRVEIRYTVREEKKVRVTE